MLADVFTAVTAHALLAGVESQLGAESVEEISNPPRMVWVPTHDTFEPGQRINTPGAITKSPKSIGTRWAGVMVHVWAETSNATKTPLADVAACEELVRKLLVAVHENAVGSYRVEGLDWVDADGAELVQKGRACNVRLAFAVPITRQPDTLATLAVVNTSGMTGSLGLPSGDITATPSP